jgi:hypothetical protein
MKELLELAKDFGTSRPIFKLTNHYSKDRISIQVCEEHKYSPEKEEGNILSELVCTEYEERFSMSDKQFQVDPSHVAHRAMRVIKDAMTDFLDKNLEMRNPRQSKVYRWYYRSLPNDNDFNDILVMVYKYMRTFCDADMKASNIEHIKNTVALMEAIMEKYNGR